MERVSTGGGIPWRSLPFADMNAPGVTYEGPARDCHSKCMRKSTESEGGLDGEMAGEGTCMETSSAVLSSLDFLVHTLRYQTFIETKTDGLWRPKVNPVPV